MAAIINRGGTWYLSWREGGKKLRKSLGTSSKREAERLLRLKNDELHRIRLSGVIALPDAASGVPTLERFVMDDYLPWRAAEFPDSHTQIEGKWVNHLLPEFGQCQLDRISVGMVERYKQSRHRAVKAATVSKELRSLQAALNRAVFLGLLSKNPIRGVKPPKDLSSAPPQWFTVEQLERLYQHSQALPGDESAKGLPPLGWADWAPVWKLMANTGLRRTEALQLRWRDVTDTAIRVLSEVDARTKSGQWRQIPLSPGAHAALDALRPLTGKNEYVLPKVHPDSLTAAFRRHAQRAGLEGTLHSLRHTFCSQLVSSGAPLRMVQKLAGHASYTTTERYAHLAPGSLQDLVKGLSL